MKLLPVGQTVALPYCFKHQYGSANAYVQGIDLSEHRDADMGIGGAAPLVGEPVVLGAHNDGRCTSHVSIIIEVGVLQLGGEDADAPRLEECNAVVRRTGHAGHRKSSTDGRTNQIRIIEVGQRVAHNDGIHARGIGRTKDGTEVTGFLDTFEDNNERAVGELQIVKA